jgi:hypothetical protein
MCPLTLEHDPEKWKPVFPRDRRESACAEIMLKQRDEIMVRYIYRIMIQYRAGQMGNPAVGVNGQRSSSCPVLEICPAQTA